MQWITKLKVKTAALGLAAALLFAPGLLNPTSGASPLVSVAVLAAVTIPVTWWLVFGNVVSVDDREGERFAAVGRLYVVTFLVFWGAMVSLRSWPAASSVVRSSFAGRLAVLGICSIAGYLLGFQRAYRPALARLRDTWVKDLSPEEREELESLKQDDRDEGHR